MLQRLDELSPREREALLWSARGKTAWETAQILSLSKRTVETHLASATKKLGAVSCTHAVVKALLQGLIVPYLVGLAVKLRTLDLDMWIGLIS